MNAAHQLRRMMREAASRAWRNKGFAGLLAGVMIVPGAAVAARSGQAAPCVAVPSVDPMCETWVATYDHTAGYSGPGWDGVRAMAAGPGVVFVTGFSHDDASTDWDIATVAVDTGTGSQRWAHRYGSGLGYEDPADVETSPDGRRVFVTGLAGSGFDHNAGMTVTLALDAGTGQKLWSRLDGPEGGLDLARAAAVSPDGSIVYVTGSTRSGEEGSHTDAVTRAFDAVTGELVWSATYDAPTAGDDAGIDLLATDEALLVAATSVGEGDPRDYDSDIVVLAYERSDPDRLGALLWESRHDGGARAGDGATALGQSPDGSRIYVTGSMQAPGASASGYNNYDYATLALDPQDGSQVWKRRFHGPSLAINEPAGLAVTASDVVVVTGNISGPTVDTDWDFGTVAYRGSTGEELWAKSYGFPRADYEAGQGVAVSADGSRAYVTGFSRVASREDVATVAYDTLSGAELWVARYNHAVTGTDFDHGDAISSITGGGVIVAASLTDNLAFLANTGNSTFNYGDFGILAYPA